MSKITFLDRQTKQKQVEKVYKDAALQLLYGDSWLSRLISPWLLPLVSGHHSFSTLYGKLQKSTLSAKKIRAFIDDFGIDESEFLVPATQFRSFNDFFIRHLKPERRPIHPDPSVAVIPADGRYYFYPNIAQCDGYVVKGQKFSLDELLLHHPHLAHEYREASMVLARLCPSDYHRFHFPCACVPGNTHLINGFLYSVNPLAIKKNIHIFTQNKRTLCELDSPVFGRILYMEVGATNVGSIQETYIPHQWQPKGAEKGYFEFGGSALIILFPQNSIQFDDDLLEATTQGLEIRCLLGQSMGKCSNPPSR